MAPPSRYSSFITLSRVKVNEPVTFSNGTRGYVTLLQEMNPQMPGQRLFWWQTCGDVSLRLIILPKSLSPRGKVDACVVVAGGRTGSVKSSDKACATKYLNILIDFVFRIWFHSGYVGGSVTLCNDDAVSWNFMDETGTLRKMFRSWLYISYLDWYVIYYYVVIYLWEKRCRILENN